MSFSMTVLGSSAMFATRERACSGYLLEFNGTRLLLDAGGGTWRNLLTHIDYKDLDAAILTHRHPDHTTDIFQAYHARHYGPHEPLPPIPLWAPTDVVAALDGFAPTFEQSFNFNSVSEGETIELAGARFSFVKMAHPVETLGVRIEIDGSVLAYSADSGPAADWDALAAGADLFVCEATLQDSDELWEGHLSASQAGELATRVGAARLLLTHLPPGRDTDLSLSEGRSSAGDADVQLAADGLRLDIGN